MTLSFRFSDPKLGKKRLCESSKIKLVSALNRSNMDRTTEKSGTQLTETQLLSLTYMSI